MVKADIIDSLIEIGSIRLGRFQLKSGLISPVYIDLRIIISFPPLLQRIAEAFAALSADLSFQRIAGIPYTALPIATAFSLLSGLPMVYARKEKKDYGTARQVEGLWQPGDTVLVIDDLITDGASKLETFSVFSAAGLIVKDVVVLVDREQGGRQRLEKAGYHLVALISIFEILERMKALGRIDPPLWSEIQRFFDAFPSVGHAAWE
jgi:uridine monophosphate synthetase